MPSGLYPWTQAVSHDLLPSSVAVGGTMNKLNCRRRAKWLY